MSKAVIFFADGFEECEGLLVVDLMRRAGIDITTASINGSLDITSSHNVKLQADALIEDIDFSSVDMIILPGGIPGTPNLAANPIVTEQCKAFARNGKLAAICAAPSILASLGLLEGKEATVNPGFEEKMNGALLTHSSVAVADNIITGRALGAAMPFALELIKQLEGQETADRISNSILL